MSSRILVIEDDRFLRKACEVGLTKRGFSVLTAVDGEEGIRQARENSPDLILLDMLMPKMTGIETLVILKQDAQTRHIPVVILSNTSIETDVQKVSALGAVGYLVKSALSLRELGDRVIGFLEEAGKPDH
jgi:CheY-like chemotaxis protein